MSVTPHTTVADLVNAEPRTIPVFQRHGIDFCCAGQVPLAEVSREEGLDLNALLTELEGAIAGLPETRDWSAAPLAALIAHIQERYHAHLREDLPRLQRMAAKVLLRHGERHADTIPALHETLDVLAQGLLEHMAKEDTVLFPAIVAASQTAPGDRNQWFTAPITVMTREHDDAGLLLTRLRALTSDYQAPEGACPTFKGLYFGLSELERLTRIHVRLEEDILFPRARALAQA